MSRYRFIDGQRATHLMRLLCHVLRVPVSGYYARQFAQQQSIAPGESAWKTALVKAFSHHGLNPWAAVHAQPAAEPAQAEPSEPQSGSAIAHICRWPAGVSVRLSDGASEQVVGWQIGAMMPEEMVTQVLQRAFWPSH